MATTRVGISGWRYEPWRGTFYPQELPQRAELEYASARLPVIEINGSFYSLQRPQSYESWYAATPADFIFTVKGPRYITHLRRLRDVETPLANFLASGLFNLGEKLGPLLWQFPPNLKYDPARFEAFFKLLPHDTQHAADVARKHDDWMKGRVQLRVDTERPMRHAVEIRHESFMDPSFVDLLRKYEVALVIAETARKWPMTQDITADFVYMRLHGDKELYRSGYSDKSLDRWAERISAWQKGSEPPDAQKISTKKPPTSSPRDVFCFFDNTDVKLRAPFDAQTLMAKLGIPPRVASGEESVAPREAPAPVGARPARKRSKPLVASSKGSTARRKRPASASAGPNGGDAPVARSKAAQRKVTSRGASPPKIAPGTPTPQRRGAPAPRVAKPRAAKPRVAASGAAKSQAVASRDGATGRKQAAAGKARVSSRKTAVSASRRRAAGGSRRSAGRSS